MIALSCYANGVREPLTHACTDLKSSNEICVLSQVITTLQHDDDDDDDDNNDNSNIMITAGL